MDGTERPLTQDEAVTWVMEQAQCSRAFARRTVAEAGAGRTPYGLRYDGGAWLVPADGMIPAADPMAYSDAALAATYETARGQYERLCRRYCDAQAAASEAREQRDEAGARTLRIEALMRERGLWGDQEARDQAAQLERIRARKARTAR
jgi:hypothetical protein